MVKPNVLIRDTEADWYAEQLSEACPDFNFFAATDDPQALEHVAKAEVLIGLAPALSPQVVARASNLKWVQALTTGVDNLLAMPELPEKVALTNCSGFHGPQMSELALLFMLSLVRKFPRMLSNQAKRQWERWPQPLLAQKTVCIVGLGTIAESLAKRCVALEMNITGVSNGRSEVPGFSAVYGRSDLRRAAAQCDFLVVVVPYSPETHHLIDSAVLEAMKPESYLINISRGGCLDEAALLATLDSGGIAGAGLDVFETEPLPQENALWSAPNVLITPHIGGMSDVYKHQAIDQVVRNLNSYAQHGSGRLEGVIPRRQGVST